MAQSLYKIAKLRKSEKWHSFILIISSKVFELARYAIPHFKALDLLFWPLAWVLTVGSIVFELYHKTPVAFFMNHPLPYLKSMVQIARDTWLSQENLSNFFSPPYQMKREQ